MRSHPLAGSRTRGWARLRRIAASALLAATFAGNFAAHHHSLLSADDGSPGREEERAVTRHNPLSRASHWHAVLGFVREHDCVACHNQRLAGLPVEGCTPAPAVSIRLALPARAVLAPASRLLCTPSRGPPILL
jgi:hypothetical protein